MSIDKDKVLNDNVINIDKTIDENYVSSLAAILRSNERPAPDAFLNKSPVLVLTDQPNVQPNHSKNDSIKKSTILDEIASINSTFKA